MRQSFKSWLNHLDKWVIRIESLKKFMVIKEIGIGG
jgi:hypothetical protein